MEKLVPRIFQITFKKSMKVCTVSILIGEDFDKMQLNIQERVNHGLQDDLDKVKIKSKMH